MSSDPKPFATKISMLCNFCQKIKPPHQSKRTSNQFSLEIYKHSCLVRHHANFDDLLQSARDGCELCAMFRPFIENGQAEKKKIDEDSDTRYGGYFKDDPFKDENDDPPTIRLTKDIVYEDDGDFYQWLDERTDEKNDVHQKHFEETLEREEEEDKLAGLVPQGYQTDNYEIVQWLFLNSKKQTGPEQIWVRSWTHYDYDYKAGGQYEASSVFTLYAGSADVDVLELSNHEWCVDNKHFGSNKTALVTELPGIWLHKEISLTISRERPLRDLEPHFEFFQQRHAFREISPPVYALNVVEDPASEACLKIARNWLSGCVDSHARCRRLSGNQTPTRLIDVGASDGSERPHLQRMTNSSKVLYVTLSHCWGPDVSQISRLVESNLAKLMNDINESAISKSFQDAIAITRGLNIRYLWIDALCIIQDSAADWAIESAQMAQYYKGSAVMISALSSPGAGRGILHLRTSDKRAPKTSFHGTELFVRPALEDVWSVIQDENHFGSDVRNGISIQPLNSRAWTLQERLFAPRILHYTAEQLIWQCKTCIASEDNQFKFMPGGKILSPVIDLVNLDKERSSAEKINRPTLFSAGWYKLLRGYTQRQITYTSDLLPGISGLAQEVQNLTGIKYLAGIWNGSTTVLIYSLLWRISSGNSAKIALNGSPSWSWASVQGEITQIEDDIHRVEQPDIDPKFFLREATLATSNPFGQVSGGEIQLSGYVHSYAGPKTFAEFQTRKLMERIALGDTKEHENWGREQLIIYDHTNFDPVDPYTNISEITALGEAQIQPVVELDIPNEEYDFSASEHVLLFMCRWHPDPKDNDDLGAEQHFLLLRRVDTKPRSKTSQGGKWTNFERVGVAELSRRHLLDITESEGWERKTGIIV